MKLEELPISIQEQISEIHENSDEILTKIKKKIRENEFILEIANEETLYYDSKNIYEVFYDDDDNPFIIKNNKEIIIDDVMFYHFLSLNLIKVYLLKDNYNNFYFCKEYYNFDKSTKDLMFQKEYFYEKLTKENIEKYINPWLLSHADFSLLKKYLDIDLDDEFIDNKIIFYLYKKTQEKPLFCKKVKKYDLLKYINFNYDVKIVSEIINKIDNNPNLEKLLDFSYCGLNELYNKINYIEELINKNIICFQN